MTTTLSRLIRVSVNATSSYISKVIVRYKYTGANSTVRALRQLTSLPTALNDAIIGMLLGDAGCYRTSNSPTSNSRLEFSFGRQRLVFAQFVQGLLKEFIQTSVTPLLVAAVKGDDKIHTSYRLKTIALPVFNFYRDLFYKLNPITGKYIKIVPRAAPHRMVRGGQVPKPSGMGPFPYSPSPSLTLGRRGLPKSELIPRLPRFRSFPPPKGGGGTAGDY
jgi:hypothetical protein